MSSEIPEEKKENPTLEDPTRSVRKSTGSAKKWKLKTDGRSKSTPAAITARREQIFELHFIRGISITALSELLGVSELTIKSDLATIKEDLAAHLRTSNVVEEAAIQVRKFDKLSQTAMMEFEGAEGARVKSNYLNIVLRAETAKVAFLTTIGYYPTKTNQIDLRVRGGSDLAEETGNSEYADVIENPMRRRKVVDFLKKALGSSSILKTALGDDKNIIDATPIERPKDE